MSSTGTTSADDITDFDATDVDFEDAEAPAKKRGPLAITLSVALLAALAVLAFFLFMLPALGTPWGANAVPDLAVLNTPQGPEDQNMPHADSQADPALGDDALVLDSVRLLGTGDQGTYWVARTQGEDVCYWYELGAGGAMGGVCTTPERFNAEGVGSRTSDVSKGIVIESYLLPDRAMPGQSPQYVVDLPGVIIIDPSIRNYARIEIPAATGNPISINTLGPL